MLLLFFVNFLKLATSHLNLAKLVICRNLLYEFYKVAIFHIKNARRKSINFLHINVRNTMFSKAHDVHTLQWYSLQIEDFQALNEKFNMETSIPYNAPPQFHSSSFSLI